MAWLVKANGGGQQVRTLKHHYTTNHHGPIVSSSCQETVDRGRLFATAPAAAARPVSSLSFFFSFVLLCSRHRVGAALLLHGPCLGFSFRSILLLSAHTKDPDVAALDQCLRVNTCTDHLEAVCSVRFS